MVEVEVTAPMTIERPRDSVRVRGLTPPPRPEDVMPRPATIPTPSVRFAEDAAKEFYTPEKVEQIIGEPDDGVPVRINEDGSITELIEAPEGDGIWRGDEEDSNGN